MNRIAEYLRNDEKPDEEHSHSSQFAVRSSQLFPGGERLAV
jgi:hypothetical protein